MNEFIVIVESNADARTATELAERVLVENVEWLERDNLQYLFRWSGLQENTDNSCWKDIKKIIQNFQDTSQFRPSRVLGKRRSNSTLLKADGAAALKILNLVRFLQKERPIQAVLLIRDLDNQPERREGLEEARSQDLDRQPKLEVILGTANRATPSANCCRSVSPLPPEKRMANFTHRTSQTMDATDRRTPQFPSSHCRCR